MLLQQQYRMSGTYRENVYNLQRKGNARCKRTTIVGSEVAACYEKVVLRFVIDWD